MSIRRDRCVHDTGINGQDLTDWLAGFETLHLDLGTGDGAYALRLARERPDVAVLGIDTCLDHLTKPARRGLPNLRFLACDATSGPAWLRGRADAISINFPYGALLHALVGGEGAAEAIFALARPGARIEIRVNASAGVAHGLPFETVREGLARTLGNVTPRGASVRVVPSATLRSFPSTWAKRIAYGRPTETVVATAVLGRHGDSQDGSDTARM